MSFQDFENYVVVITGASTGLGRALAVETARRGAVDVVINFARSAEEAETTASLVRAEGARAHLVQGDVSRDEDCRTIAAAAASLGRVDALFNNAGVTKFAQNHADLDAVSAEDFLGLYAVNVASWKPRPSLELWSTPRPSPAWRGSARPCPTQRPRAP